MGLLPITPVARFTMERKMSGWRKSPLGVHSYPNYINQGVAIHGGPRLCRPFPPGTAAFEF